MREVKRIADQALKMFGGGAWHGPSVLEVIADVDASVAASHPISGAHSIWELVLHLVATQAILLRRIRGETAGLKTEDFWPELPPASESGWAETVERLKKQEAELQKAIEAFPEARLDARLTAEGSSAYNNFHGHVQHNAYHAGQISLLKKASRA
ncbi:MAG TPA: DinB family protein [Gemmataceae bacterium]|nr:DinB family protein [Gemmataceae bacterium]